MRDRETCIDCAKQSPETETDYTLISAQFGWRLSRKRMPEGNFVVQWRCPECWRAYKSTKAPNEPLVGWPPHLPADSPSASRFPPHEASTEPPRAVRAYTPTPPGPGLAPHAPHAMNDPRAVTAPSTPTSGMRGTQLPRAKGVPTPKPPIPTAENGGVPRPPSKPRG